MSATDHNSPADSPFFAGLFSRSQIDDIRTCLLESERIWDENLMDEWCCTVMPFGKYIGKDMGDVPLKYLDETISVMPPTWFVRQVIRFVDLAMKHPIYAGVCPNSVPRQSCREMMASAAIEFASMDAAASESNPTNAKSPSTGATE